MDFTKLFVIFLCISIFQQKSSANNASILPEIEILEELEKLEKDNKEVEVIRILGRRAQEGQFPFMVYIQRNTDRLNVIVGCSGVILNGDTVLTAAHCLCEPKNTTKLLPANDMYVTLEFNELKMKETNKTILYKVKWMLLHEDYDPLTRANDIAIIKTVSSFSGINESFKPVQLLEEVPNGKYYLPGWNHLVEFMPLYPIPWLQYVIVEKVELNLCIQAFNFLPKDPQNFVCVGETRDRSIEQYGENGPKYLESLCQGDSGGPLIYPSKKSNRLVGIECMRPNCSEATRWNNTQFYALYTNANRFKKWITDFTTTENQTVSTTTKKQPGSTTTKHQPKDKRKRIFGTKAEEGQFPYMVYIHHKIDQLRQISGCSGVILNGDTVLTAAHCLCEPKNTKKLLPADDMYVTLEINELRMKDADKTVLYKVRWMYLHEDYDPSTRANDIAVIRTAWGFFGLQSVSSVQLPGDVPDGKYYLPGWNHIVEFNPLFSIPWLQYVIVRKVDLIYCIKAFNFHPKDSQNFVCIGEMLDRRNEQIGYDGPKYLENLCQGDSGGPLIYPLQKPNLLVGIECMRPKCSEATIWNIKPQQYALYTNVARYKKWITDVSTTGKPTTKKPVIASTKKPVSLIVTSSINASVSNIQTTKPTRPYETTKDPDLTTEDVETENDEEKEVSYKSEMHEKEELALITFFIGFFILLIITALAAILDCIVAKCHRR